MESDIVFRIAIVHATDLETAIDTANVMTVSGKILSTNGERVYKRPMRKGPKVFKRLQTEANGLSFLQPFTVRKNGVNSWAESRVETRVNRIVRDSSTFSRFGRNRERIHRKNHPREGGGIVVTIHYYCCRCIY